MTQKHFHLAARLLFALFLVGSGGTGLYGFYFSGEPMTAPEGAPGTELFNAVLNSTWLFPWIATFKLSAGILIAVPRTAKLGIIAAFPYSINIFLWTVFGNPGDLPMGAIVLVLNILLLRAHWDHYKGILA
jgi:hypothetical protein